MADTNSIAHELDTLAEGFKVDDDGLTLLWAGPEYRGYFLPHSRINTPAKLLGVIWHVGTKDWEGMTPSRIAYLCKVLCQRNGWDMRF